MLKFIEGQTFLKGELIVGEKRVAAHVLFSLASDEALQVHSNTARLLELADGEAVQFVTRGHELFSASPKVERLGALEKLTRDFARELEEIPVVAVVGLGAFGTRVLDIDPRQRILRLTGGSLSTLSPAVAPTTARAPEVGERIELPLLPGGGLRVPVRMLRGAVERAGCAVLDSASYHLMVNADWLRHAGEVESATDALLLGPWNLLHATAQRQVTSAELPARDVTLSLGNALLENLRLRVDLGRRVVHCECIEVLPDPSASAEAFRALHLKDPALVQRWLDAQPEHELRLELATALLEWRTRQRPLPDAASLMAALAAKVAADKPARKSRQILELVARWKAEAPEVHALLFKPALELAVATATEDEDGTALHQARSEIGAMLLDAGDLEGAWRQLLAAALGMPRDGPVNERLGRLYERMGKRERAFSRFLQAAITPEAGSDGLAGLARMRAAEGGAPYKVNELERMLEGRAPIFEPASRYRSATAPSRRVLVELFTGAHCKPCAAADLAFEGLQHHFAAGEVSCVQHHLHVPQPDPLTTRAGLLRAADLGVSGTPTLVLDGQWEVPLGGSQADTAKRFRELVAAIEKRLGSETPWRLQLAPRAESGRLHVSVTIAGPKGSKAKFTAWVCERSMIMPGASGIVFHRQVNRGPLTAAPVAIELGADAHQQSLSVLLSDLDAANVAHQDEVEAESERAFPLRAGSIDPAEIVIVGVLVAEGAVVQTAAVELVPRESSSEPPR